MKKVQKAIAGAVTILLNLCLLASVSQAQLTEVAKLTASDAGTGGSDPRFGSSLALDGNRAIFGAGLKNGVAQSSGGAYIFEQNASGAWIEVANLTQSDPVIFDHFGSSVAISGDYAIVGAYRKGNFTGAAYIFERSAGGTWSEVAKLEASDKEVEDSFGGVVAIDGNCAMVGAADEATGGAYAGAVYVFERNAAGTWGQVAKIQPSTNQALANFGNDISMSGKRALIGAWSENNAVGAAYIFERGAGGTWSETARIQVSSQTPEPRFGVSVSLDGDRAVIGAQNTNVGAKFQVGTAYVFERDANGTWSETATLQHSDRLGADFFGRVVAVSGERALIGAPEKGFLDQYDAKGLVYLFERNGDGTWSEKDKFTSSDVDFNDGFGQAISLDGDNAMIGTEFAETAYYFEASTNQAPTAHAGADQSICTSTGSANVTLDGSGSSDPDSNPLTYTWKEGATTLGTGVTPTVSLNVGAHTIDLTVDDGNGGTDTDQVVVTVRSAPSVTVADVSVCAGQTASMTANVSGGAAPFTYAWTGPGGFTATSQSINPTAAGAYSVIVTDNHGCTGTDSGNLSVNANPTVTVVDAATCAGGGATMSATVSGGAAPFTYAWTGPGGFTSTSQSINPTTAGTYSVTVTDNHGCTGTDSGVLTINANPVVTVADVSVCSGQTATMTANVSGGAAPFTHAWMGPGGFTASTQSINPTVAGTYDVTVTDVHGCAGTGAGDLTINANPTADAGADQTIYAGNTVQLGGAPTASGPGALTISWTPSGDLDDPAAANPMATPGTTTTYTVTVTSDNGCQATDQVTITVQSPADVINTACAQVQALINDPNTPSDALSALQSAKDALNQALSADAAGNTGDFFDLIRDAADDLEKARHKGADTDPAAVLLSSLARDIATQKRNDVFVCDPNPSGKMQDDIDDGDKDLADGDTEVSGTYHGDGIKDYSKAWESYCDALNRCGSPKAFVEADERSEIQALPTAFALHQNYPNPFNPTTTIQFDLAEAGHVSLNIYSSAGQLVRTLAFGDYAPGAHKVTWDARDHSGARVASGLYLYTIKVGQQFTAQKKLLLMK